VAGQPFKNYTLEREIGKGGMASVYLATDNDSGRKVAIKFLLPSIASNQSFVRQFVEEFRANQYLRHANIVETIEGGEHDGRWFMAMELLDGGSLKDLLRLGHRFPLDLAVHVIINTLKGLQHSHHCGIVHQDMKPANLMIQKDGSIKIADFGISRIAGPGVWTPTGKIRGTPAYMSPEQAGGKEPTYRWDLFSTGVMFYELVAGFNPFGAKDPQAALKKIVGENPPPLVRAVPTIPFDLEVILARMLEKDPDRRYQNADSILGDLQVLTRKLQLAYSQDIFREWMEDSDTMSRRLAAHRGRYHLEQGKALLERGAEYADLAVWQFYRAALTDRANQEAGRLLQSAAQAHGYLLQKTSSMDIQALEKKLSDKPDDIASLLQAARLYRTERNPLQTYFYARMALSLAPLDAGNVAAVGKVIGAKKLEHL
jgi:serine/threonine protein kinase